MNDTDRICRWLRAISMQLIVVAMLGAIYGALT